MTNTALSDTKKRDTTEMKRRKPTAREDLRLIKKVLATVIDPDCPTAAFNKQLMDLEVAKSIALQQASVSKAKDKIVFLNLGLEVLTASVALLKSRGILPRRQT